MDINKKYGWSDIKAKFIELFPNLPESKYRIVPDNYAGWEVKIKKWWFPVWWFECEKPGEPCNTHINRNNAEFFIEKHKRGFKR